MKIQQDEFKVCGGPVKTSFETQVHETQGVSTHHWYILKLKPHCEQSCFNNFQQQEVEVYMPRLLAPSSNRKKNELKATPLFPGYLFFRLDDNSRYWPYMKWAPGVSYLLKNDEGPLIVPPGIVESIRRREAWQHVEILEEAARPFQAGDRVEVLDGPFQGLEAIFERRLNAAGRCQILIEILGRLSNVTLPGKDLQRLMGR